MSTGKYKNKNMIIKVNEKDHSLGYVDKLAAHKEAILHRAFSVFILNNKGEMLLQKRADNKYHGGGLWSNTCCSHPTEDENLKIQAEKRLMEEMGFKTKIGKIGEAKYNLKVGNLIEHEYDHLFIGTYNGEIKPNPKEVSDYKWVSLPKLEKDLEDNPGIYTPWFKFLYPRVVKNLQTFHVD